jgi:hypothetical protein
MTKPTITPRTAAGIPIISTEGQKVYVEAPLWCQRTSQFENDVSGSPLLNVNGSTPQGSELVIWNGTGAGDTGGDWTQGGTIDTAVEAAEADRGFGTNGLDMQTAKNKYLTFTTGTPMTPESYTNLVIWVNTQTHPGGSTVPVNWRLSGDQKGDWCYIGNYIDEWTPGVWKKIQIPIADFNLDPGQTVDQLRINFLVKSGHDYWFDDIHLEDGGGDGPQTFVVGPDPTEQPDDIWHVDFLKLLVVSGDSGWNATTMFNLASALEVGLQLRLIDDTDGILWSHMLKDNTDLWGVLTEENFVDFPNATRQIVWRMDPTIGRIILTATRRLEWVVNDDLSPLTKLRAFCNYGKEVTT